MPSLLGTADVAAKVRRWAPTGLGILLSLVPWLGWTRSGTVVRNSFETFRAAQVLGLDELTPLRVIWFTVPVLPLVVAALTVADRRRLAALVLLMHALLVGAVGLVVLGSGVRGGVGAQVAVVVAGVAIAAGGWWLVTAERPHDLSRLG